MGCPVKVSVPALFIMLLVWIHDVLEQQCLFSLHLESTCSQPRPSWASIMGAYRITNYCAHPFVAVLDPKVGVEVIHELYTSPHSAISPDTLLHTVMVIRRHTFEAIHQYHIPSDAVIVCF
jgi:hypothetical protein